MEETMNQLFRLIVFVALMTGLLAACAPAPAPAAPPPAEKPAATEAPKPAPTAAPAATKAPEPTKAPAPAAPAAGGTFIDASFADAVSFQPLLTSDNASSSYQALVWAGLTRIDPKTLEIVGVMYEGKPTISADGAKLTWKLRKDLKWSDGKPITAQDVIFTWQKMMDEKVKFIYRKTYQDSFTDVKALDDSTVEYTLKVPGYCPAVVNSGLVAPQPKHVFENLDINTADVNIKPAVTSGAFKFKEWTKDDHFTASPGYAGFVRGLPKLEGYTYRILKDNTVQTQLFKTQDVDVAYPDPVDWDEISKLPHAQPVAYYSATGASWTYIGFNLRNALLADKTLRQAISTAINKKEMVDTIRLGHAKPQYSMLPASSWAAADEKELPKFDFDAAKAKKMLDDAGYKPGADGIRVSKDGKPLKFRLHYNSGNKQREQIAIITQQYLKDVGIAAEVIAEEWNAYLDRVNKTRDMDMYILGWTGGYDPSSTKNIWASDGGQNSTGYNNPKVDELFKKAETVPGCVQADRKALYVEIQKAIAEDQPYIFLYTNENLNVYNKRVGLLPLTGLGVTYNIEELSINPQAKK
jgi:peptide/nickel transport system substrate-binding protein